MIEYNLTLVTGYYRELTLHLIDFTLSQGEVVPMHISSSEVVMSPWSAMYNCLASMDKNQIFSKIWTTVSYHFHCTTSASDRIFEELFSTEGEEKGLVIIHIGRRLTERLFGVASKHVT